MKIIYNRGDSERLYGHDETCPGKPDCGHCKWCGEDYTGDKCPCESELDTEVERHLPANHRGDDPFTIGQFPCRCAEDQLDELAKRTIAKLEKCSEAWRDMETLFTELFKVHK